MDNRNYGFKHIELENCFMAPNWIDLLVSVDD